MRRTRSTPTDEIVLAANGTIHQAGADTDMTDALRDASTNSLYVFCKAVMGMYKFVPHLHLPLCNWMQEVPPHRRVLLTPRDTFKTSMARCLGMYMTIQTPASNRFFPGRDGTNLRLLYAAENERRALSRISWIRRQYENNALFRALWPERVWHERADAPMWTLSHYALPRTEDYPEGTFEGAGVDTGSTGGHFDVILKDDLIGLRSRKQPKLMEAAVEWWKTSHSLMNDPEVSLDYVFGTRWASEDLYTWIEENETEYDVQVYSCFKSDGSLLFPERLTRERLEGFKRKYGELYYLNYENRAEGGGTTAFNMQFCGLFDVVGKEREIVLTGNPEPTRRILEVIENGHIPAQTRVTPKPFYKQTPEERQETWQKMMENWRRDRINRIAFS